MARSSITKAYNKIQELSWEPTFATPVKKYPTDYTFTKAPKKEPLKQVMQSYFPMQEEKDDRSMGAMDSALRGNMFRYASIRIPGSEEYRAYSMANTPRTTDRLEFIIKTFPGGRFSSLLDGGFAIGQELEVKGPYGVFM